MGNLRQSMTDEEWAEMQPSRTKTLLDIIEPLEGEPNILSDLVDYLDTYEAVKVIETWNLDFATGSAVKYILQAGKKPDNALDDLEKAKWYICHAIEKLKRGK